MFRNPTVLFWARLAREGRSKLQTQFKKYPKITNAFSGFVTFGVGDVMAQQIGGDFGSWDKTRTFQAGLLGATMNGWCLHYWYRSLDFVFGANMKSKLGIAMKIIADQIVYAPFAITSYFALSIYQKSETKIMASMAEDFELKVCDSFATVFLADCCLWPFVNFLNFRVVPIVYRPTFIALAQLSWQTYLSSASHWDAAQSTVTLPSIASKGEQKPPFPFPDQVIIASAQEKSDRQTHRRASTEF